MQKALILLISLLISFKIQAQQEQHSRVRINMRGKDIRNIARLGLETEHGFFMPNFYFINEFSRTELNLLDKNGFEYTVLIPDLEKYLIEENKKADERLLQLRGGENCSKPTLPVPKNYRFGQMGGYLTYEEMLSVLDSMRLLYPNLISARQSIADTLKSVEGRPIYWLRLSDNADKEEDEPEILFTALHHAREPNSLSQLIYFMWYLLENYEKDSSVKNLVDNTEMYIMPCVNPDGYVYNQTTNPNGGGFWRKNRRVNSDNTYGVDLNRNYNSLWGQDDIGSSPSPNASTYRGTAPFSEPETRAVRFLCKQHNFKIALNYHTLSNVLVLPDNFNKISSLDEQFYTNFAQFITKENGFKYGNALQTVGYSVNGASDEWMYGDSDVKPRIFSLTPEVGPSQLGFWPPKSEILNLNQSTLDLNLKALSFLLDYTLITDKTPFFLNEKTGKINLNVKRIGLQNGSISVSLKPISGNIASFSAAKSFNLKQFEATDTQFDYVLKDIIKNGDKITFEILINNGVSIKRDTISKIYGSVEKKIFTEGGDNVQQWQNSQNLWSATTERFVSPPSSITDSPNSNYLRNTSATFVQSQFIEIPKEAFRATLRFRAWWELESDKDYVQLSVSTDGTNFQPLCGNYTRTAFNGSALGQPIYDGFNTEWIYENVDLTPYIGKNIKLQWKIVSNESIQYEGFYFDDMDITVVNSTATFTQFLSDNDFILNQNNPNPTEGVTHINYLFTTDKKDNIQLLVTDISGKIIFKYKVQDVDNHNIALNTEGWQPGIYFYWMDINGKRTTVKKLVKI